MAHYAVLDNNIVTQVFVGKDEGDTNWEEYYGAKRTSYNTHGGVHSNDGIPFRKNYAGIGYTYDEGRDAFISPQPHASWTLNEDTCLWDSPVPYPSEGVHEWDEDNQEWVDASIPPQPYASWTLNEDTCLWDSPVPYPSEGVHEWDEDNQEWVEISDE